MGALRLDDPPTDSAVPGSQPRSLVTRLSRAGRSLLFLAVYSTYVLFIMAPIQRLVIGPLVALRPASRRALMRAWLRLQARAVLAPARRLAGLRLEVEGALPGESCLVLMNHQSLFDVPLAFLLGPGPYPLIPTRASYARGIPGISYIMHLARCPFVAQGGRVTEKERETLAAAADEVARGEQSLLIFPEGHRSRNGEMLPFMTSGLRIILPRVAGRPVYAVVVDGWWRLRTLGDVARRLAGTSARAVVLGPFTAPADPAAHDGFVRELRARMVEALGRMRAAPPPPRGMPMPPADPALRAALARDLERPPDPAAARIAGGLARAFGLGTLALLHYGSHAQGSGVTADSARDYFVILERYAEGYRALAATGRLRLAPAAAALLNRMLPPNVIAVSAGSPPEETKCAVLSLADLRRACSPRAKDNFTRARLFQQVQLAWARDDAARATVVDALVAARAATFDWGRAHLPSSFAAESYWTALLRVSYAAEIRPEGAERLDALIAAQRETLSPMYAALLEHLAARGRVARDGAAYRDPRPPGRLARLRSRGFLAASKARATLRWGKYVALYDGWLDYVVHKVERRAGVTIELTGRERRWPLVFLWAKAIRVLRGRRSGRGR